MLLDSNIVIYAFDPAHVRVAKFLRGRSVQVSILTQIEVMGYWRLTDDEHRCFAAFFSELAVLDITPEFANRAIALRRVRNMGLADAVIAATALTHALPLATHNTGDFEWVTELELIDPVAAPPA